MMKTNILAAILAGILAAFLSSCGTDNAVNQSLLTTGASSSSNQRVIDVLRQKHTPTIVAAKTPDAFSGELALYGDLRFPYVLTSIEQIGKMLLQASKFERVAIRYRVADCAAFDDRSSPTGHVVFCLDTLRQLTTMAELNFVIAHETAHVLLGHGAAALKRGNVLSVTAKSLVDTTPIVGSVARAANNSADFRQWRQDELEADRLAIDLLANAGLSVSGAETAFLTIQGRALKRATSNRSFQYTSVAARNAKISHPAQLPGAAASAAALPAALFVDLIESSVDKRSHPDLVERASAAKQYILEFGLSNNDARGKTSLDDHLGKQWKQLRQDFRAFDAAQDALARTAAKSPTQAEAREQLRDVLTAFKRLSQGPLGDIPRVRFSLSRLSTIYGDDDGVIDDYRRLTAADGAGFGVYFVWGMAFRDQLWKRRAIDAISEGVARFHPSKRPGWLTTPDIPTEGYHYGILLGKMAKLYTILDLPETASRFRQSCKETFGPALNKQAIVERGVVSSEEIQAQTIAIVCGSEQLGRPGFEKNADIELGYLLRTYGDWII